ncbi:CHAP domain-containing protein [Microbispora sp. RL4-1S]|uniref:CHAP domain-containing protein n=1 Tax=Microbispora oryzae TaxID=2806554 RepID=A0A941AKX8_9ACTN|nr:CHAP domain-containing protein [Microbispora oryzae]MBP2707965.1 CHAP domain-containing protein [Microbispora oryzae]
MHALNTFTRALALAAVLTAGGMAASPMAAHADAVPAAPVARAAAVAEQPLAEVAATLPRVSPADVLRLAASQKGITENAQGGGTKFQAWYMSTPRARETVARDGGSISEYANAAWCDMFVSWVGNKLGIQPVMGWDSYTVEHARWFEQNNRFGTVPKPGAVVFFAWDGGKSIDDIEHVGFVVKDNGNGTIQTIEGNSDGAVQTRTRSTAYVAGYGYPYYTAP